MDTPKAPPAATTDPAATLARVLARMAYSPDHEMRDLRREVLGLTRSDAVPGAQRDPAPVCRCEQSTREGDDSCPVHDRDGRQSPPEETPRPRRRRGTDPACARCQGQGTVPLPASLGGAHHACPVCFPPRSDEGRHLLRAVERIGQLEMQVATLLERFPEGAAVGLKTLDDALSVVSEERAALASRLDRAIELLGTSPDSDYRRCARILRDGGMP